METTETGKDKTRQAPKRYRFAQTDTLTKVGEKIDALNRTIKFADADVDTSSVSKIVDAMLEMKPTKTVYSGGSSRRQTLGNSRSIEDMYMACKHYHPNVKIEDVRDYLQEKNSNYEINAGFCCTHQKYMFYRSKYPIGYMWRSKAHVGNFGIR